MMRKSLIAGIFCAVLCCAAAVQAKPTIAVMPFNFSRGFQTVVRGTNQGGFTVTRAVIEREFSNRLIIFLVKSRKFTVLNREDISKIIDESTLTESEWAKPGQEQKVGKLLSSDYLVTGTINRVEFLVRNVFIRLTGKNSQRVTATFKMQFKITEVSSGKVVFASQVIEKLTSREIREMIPASERRDFTLADYRDVLFERVANIVGNDILGGIYPVKIANVNGKIVLLNRGQGGGIKVGDRYEVFKLGTAVVDPDTGESLGSSETKAGIIQVFSVEPKFSKAKIISEEIPIQNGWICRKGKPAPAPAAAYPQATPGW